MSRANALSTIRQAHHKSALQDLNVDFLWLAGQYGGVTPGGRYGVFLVFS